MNAIEQDNELFKMVYDNKESCYNLILKKASYDTTIELAGLISWIHQVSVNMPEVKVRLGAQVETKIISQ